MPYKSDAQRKAVWAHRRQRSKHVPFKSKAQMKACFAKKEHGEAKGWNCHEWAEHTSNIKALPEHAKSASPLATSLGELAAKNACSMTTKNMKKPMKKISDDRNAVAPGMPSRPPSHPANAPRDAGPPVPHQPAAPPIPAANAVQLPALQAPRPQQQPSMMHQLGQGAGQLTGSVYRLGQAAGRWLGR